MTQCAGHMSSMSKHGQAGCFSWDDAQISEIGSRGHESAFELSYFFGVFRLPGTPRAAATQTARPATMSSSSKDEVERRAKGSVPRLQRVALNFTKLASHQTSGALVALYKQ